MKRIILLALVMLSFLPSIEARPVDGCLLPSEIKKRPKAWVKPKVETDKQYEDGRRHISTKSVSFANTGMRGKVYPTICWLRKSIWDNGTSYTLVFDITREEKTLIGEGSRLLLKFDDDSIIELTINNKVDGLSNEPNVGRSVYGGGMVYTYYTCHPSYSLTEQQIQKIISQEVVKIRMEINTGEGYVDVGTDNTKGLYFSDTLRECFNAIAEKEKQSNGLHDGF
jgi:hypothetical protein